MSVDKKYYYLKLKENFFDSPQLQFLESLPNGVEYSNILLKLYLKSLKYEGKLMISDKIPYNTVIISNVLKKDIKLIEEALNWFDQLGLVEVLSNGDIYMLDIQNFIGKSSSEADRKREYRQRIEKEKEALKEQGQKSGHLSCEKENIFRYNDLEISKETKSTMEKDKYIDDEELDLDL